MFGGSVVLDVRQLLPRCSLAMVAILGVFLVGCGALQVGTLESRRQRALRLIADMGEPPAVLGRASEVVLAIVSSPPNAEVYWSRDGSSFQRFMAGGGLTPLSHRSSRWAADLWFQVRKKGFKDSPPRKVRLTENKTLNFALEPVQASPPDADCKNAQALFREYCAVCHGAEGRGEGPAASMLNPLPADLLDQAYVGRLSDAHLFKVIKEGGNAADRSRLMPAWGELLSDQTISLLVYFIRTAAAMPHTGGGGAAESLDSRRVIHEGEKLFATYCAACHGESGEGNGPLSPTLNPHPANLANAAYLSTLNDTYLERVIANGGPAVRRSPLMPPWKEWLNGQQISYVVAYVRQLSKGKSRDSETTAAAATPDTATSGAAERGGKVYSTYCISCHGRNAKGDGPAGLALKPKPTDLTNATYLATQTDAYLRTVIQGGGAAVGKSPLMPPWNQALQQDQVADLVAFIRKVSNTREPAATVTLAKPTGNVVAGAKVFQQFCVSCHGSQGRGDGPASAVLQPRPTDLTAAQYFRTVTDDYLRKVIAGGGVKVGKSPLMPAWGNALNEAQLTDLIAFLRKLSATSGAASGAATLTVNYRGSIDEGVRIYQHYCAACHGPQGKGDGAAIRGYTPRPADLTNTGYLRQLNDDYLRTVIAKGGAAVGKAGLMPPLGQALGDRGLNDVVAFIRKISGTQP